MWHLLTFMHPICSLLTLPFVILHCFMAVLILFCVCLTYYNLFLFYQIPLHSLRILEYYSSIVFILSVFGTIVLICFYFNILVNPTINDYFRFRYFCNPQDFILSVWRAVPGGSWIPSGLVFYFCGGLKECNLALLLSLALLCASMHR